MQQALELDEGPQQLLVNELVLVFARKQVALHLRAELLLHPFHSVYDFAYSLLCGLESTRLLLIGAATGKLGSSLFQFVHTAYLHRVKLGGAWVFLIATNPVVEVDSLLYLKGLGGRRIILSRTRQEIDVVDHDLFWHVVFVEVNEVLAGILLEAVIKAVHKLVVFAARVRA